MPARTPSNPHDSAPASDPPAADERRQSAPDRRARPWYSLLYGGFRPRRRRGRRSSDDAHPLTDWYPAALLASALLTLILCVADAALTLWLLAHGAVEANPLMALVVNGDARRFVLLKLALTAGGVICLVVLARVRLFRRLPASMLVHATLAGYLLLVGYEISLAANLNGP
jgi:hypothetical protein